MKLFNVNNKLSQLYTLQTKKNSLAWTHPYTHKLNSLEALPDICRLPSLPSGIYRASPFWKPPARQRKMGSTSACRSRQVPPVQQNVKTLFEKKGETLMKIPLFSSRRHPPKIDSSKNRQVGAMKIKMLTTSNSSMRSTHSSWPSVIWLISRRLTVLLRSSPT